MLSLEGTPLTSVWGLKLLATSVWGLKLLATSVWGLKLLATSVQYALSWHGSLLDALTRRHASH
jgi:hypothetical protein